MAAHQQALYAVGTYHGLTMEQREAQEAHEMATEKELKRPTIVETTVGDGEYVTKPGRSLSHNIGSVVIDLLVAMSAFYFIIFAALAHIWDDRPASDLESKALLRAAGFGVTIFPIIFAITAAKLIKAVATWRLEHGATVGLLEYLLGSRSLASAFMAPVKFRTVNIFVPILIIMWAFSPAGGQSALRIVTVEPKYTNTEQEFHYMDLAHSSGATIEGVSSRTSYIPAIYAAFNAGLTSPSSSKNGTQDIFGNIQVPMLETISANGQPDAEGWYNTTQKQNITYAALLGLPILGAQPNANSTFNVETSYFNINCNVTGLLDGNATLLNPNNDTMTSFQAQDFAVWFDATHTAAASRPRQIGWTSRANPNGDVQVTNASCTLATTYVETSIHCNATLACNTVAIRASKKGNQPAVLSALDGITEPNGSGILAPSFFQTFVDATAQKHPGVAGPMEYFFIDPAFPYSGPTKPGWQSIFPIGSELFSRRFAQLLNTYWLSVIAPNAITGDFTNPTNDQYAVATTKGNRQNKQLVLRCHTPFLVVLVIASSIIFIAGMITAYLDAVRRGPDVLDNFVNTLRDSPHVHVDFGPSMEDGADKIKRLRSTTVKMGDVKPDDPVGLVAIATPTASQPVHMLTPRREYM